MCYYSTAMRTLIIYESLCGATKKYAEDIAKAVAADVVPLKKFKSKMAADYDTIVFGGWVKGGQIEGLNKFLSSWEKMEGKDVVVFSSGMSLVTKETRDHMISVNLLYMYHIRYYMLRGNFEFEKLDWKNKLMMNLNLKRIESDPEATPDQKALLSIRNTPMLYYDQKGVDRIVTVINQIAVSKL